jgi:D-alanine-D-alanine ligase
MSKHVAVLMGGLSAEREVSLVSGAACSNALRERGYQVTTVDVQRDVGALLTRMYPRPDVVFNALHGRFGEDGCIQGLLNILGIPYTHSGLLASALAMDKPTAKSVFAAAGIPVVEHQVLTLDQIDAGQIMKPPFVVKPINEGSSVGIHIVLEGSNFSLSRESWTYGRHVMVERYIPGRELTVTVMGDRALAVTEIIAQGGHSFYDYGAKYETGGSRHIIPAAIDQAVYAKALDYSLRAHKALGCRGVSRSDLRFDGKNLFILEVNTQPGMTPTSLVPEQAAHAHISFAELVSWMVEHAECDA